MGNASSSSGRGHHEETVDYGSLTPQGIYTGPRDWNQAIVAQLIIDRKLAPFYRPLEEYEDSWDEDQILAARKEPAQDPEGAHSETSSTRPESIHSSISRTHHKRPSAAAKEAARNPEACIYRGAVECPICFLYYPPNINHSRCCDQAICTECFVQIKRAEPTATHLVSEPAACPYCVQENFGIVYSPPPWRAGINSDGYASPTWPNSSRGASQQSLVQPKEAMKKRRKSLGADSPEVVTIDQIRPDWEAKLAAVRAQVARRANRRIIMRQVGDRLIPVGITSGRIQAISPEEAAEMAEGGGDRGSRRSRRRQQRDDLNQYLGAMGLGGQDLEELMVMEAMRLSLIEHEEQERKRKAEEAKKQAAEGGQPTETEGAGSSASPAAAAETTPSVPPPAPSGSGSSSGGSSPSHLTPDNVESGNTSRHRSSSSLSSWRRRSPSPFETVGAAVRSATSTVSALVTPSARSETPRPPEGATPEPTAPMEELPRQESPAQEQAELPVPTDSATSDAVSDDTTSQAPVVTVVEPAQEVPELTEDVASSPGSDATVAATPPTEATLEPSVSGRAQRSQSFASSVTSDNDQASTAYDYLPSSPNSSSSSIAHKPLLNSSPAAPSQSYNTSPDPSAPSQA